MNTTGVGGATELRIVLDYPKNVSLNKAYRRRGGVVKNGQAVYGARALTDEVKAWKATVIETAALAANRAHYEIPALGDLAFWMVMLPPDRRRRDADSLLKHVLDGVAAALGFDDSRVVDLRVYKHFDFNVSPRLIVRLGVAASVPCQECGWW